MQSKMLTIAAVLAATLLTGIFSATPMAVYAGGDDDDNGGDSSETNTQQRLRQNNIGGSDSTNFNCGQNLISSPNVEQFCPVTSDGTDPVPPVVLTCEECIDEFISSIGADVILVFAILTAFDCDGLTDAEITTLIADLDTALTPDLDVAIARLSACLTALA